ncbi:hypothetical protein PHYBOEH_007032 [Phytophthora boehmeriae]|uniref:OTU domain-containing protein 1 n=1 Tax=Phytophthora boehmeriae TaxID=109152 RepID=A0A8T1W903_9STRA|nr:hypothetical protein PHYBOEH_007032 [Phytophthora boehmeriae]
MNDPCASYYDQETGLYHMFYQLNPNSTIWGNMTRGHVVSQDQVTWEDYPDALYPFQDKWDPLVEYLFGEHVVYATTNDGGKTWQKGSEPLIELPLTGLNVAGWRDPIPFHSKSLDRHFGYDTVASICAEDTRVKFVNAAGHKQMVAAVSDFEATPYREMTDENTPNVASPRPNPKERDASWTSEEKVEAHYAAIDWSVVQILIDGNCLFRAISDQLYTNELYHRDIRQQLVDFIEKEQQHFKPFVENEDVSEYCTQMRKDGEWGGHFALYAAAKLFNIHIVMHMGPVRRIRIESNDDGDPAPPQPPYRILHLLYKDHHYSSLHSKAKATAVATTDSTDKRV